MIDAAFLMHQARSLVSRVTEPCAIGNCQHMSLGLVCKFCSRRVCLRHGVVQVSVPPAPVCVSCIIDLNEDLLEDVDERRGS